jgi:hypothetical protein
LEKYSKSTKYGQQYIYTIKYKTLELSSRHTGPSSRSESVVCSQQTAAEQEIKFEEREKKTPLNII